FTMTALPGSPSIHNVIAATALKTSLLASPWIGLISAAIMLVLGLLYLEWERKRAKARGDGFKAALTDVLPDEKLDTHNFPGPVMALVPLLAVLVIIIAPQMAGKFIAEPQGVIAFAISQPLLWPSLAMVIGALLAVVLLPKALQRPMKTLSRGAENAILPLMNTAAVIGFGGVVVQTAGFSKFAGLMIDADIDPLLSAFLSVNIVAGIVGSSSGGLQIFMESLAPHYIEAGVPPELLHRIATLGSGGLDSLPHCGAIITMFTVMGITHKEAYKDVAVITILIPLIATAAILAWLLIVGY
ncbi:MAG: GntP family permease, partial [Candidatus Hydrogenedentes bacterium]|nr:GntP family permease [Candidatus Hydrogenedentota bacterium]